MTYKCSGCGKKFKRQKDLKDHLELFGCGGSKGKQTCLNRFVDRGKDLNIIGDVRHKLYGGSCQ